MNAADIRSEFTIKIKNPTTIPKLGPNENKEAIKIVKITNKIPRSIKSGPTQEYSNQGTQGFN